jgi:hypothetical protein
MARKDGAVAPGLRLVAESQAALVEGEVGRPVLADREIELCPADADRRRRRLDRVGRLLARAGDEAERAANRIDREFRGRRLVGEDEAIDGEL